MAGASRIPPRWPRAANNFQDVNLFPASLIKRIEILKDGASAIYGSDAVGGVVNVLLNNDYEGLEISGRYGFAEERRHFGQSRERHRRVRR